MGREEEGNLGRGERISRQVQHDFSGVLHKARAGVVGAKASRNKPLQVVPQLFLGFTLTPMLELAHGEVRPLICTVLFYSWVRVCTSLSLHRGVSPSSLMNATRA